MKEAEFEPLAPQLPVFVASTVPVATVWFALAGLYTYTTAVSGCAMSVPGTAAVSCLLLTNDVVKEAPFHTTTALLSKFPPLTVRTNPPPPAEALFGESEFSDGVEGQEHETAGKKKIANTPERRRCFFVVIDEADQPYLRYGRIQLIPISG